MSTAWLSELASKWWDIVSVMAWQSSALIISVLAFAVMTRRSSAYLRYAVLLLPIIKLLMPPIPVKVPDTLFRSSEQLTTTHTPAPEVSTVSFGYSEAGYADQVLEH